MSLSNRLGLLGRKVGMMRIFTDDGDAVPVTVLDVSNNRVTQVKTEATAGYSAIQVAFGSRKASRVNKPAAGHLAKAGVEAGEVLKEFRVSADIAGQYAPGAVLPVSVFAAGQKVALAICYEDVFGEELINQLPEATLLVNVSNDAWFGDTAEPALHNRVARVRAIETRRDLVRAVNTGVSAHISATGEELVAEIERRP